MRQCIVLLLLWIISVASTQTLDEITREELLTPAQYLIGQLVHWTLLEVCIASKKPTFHEIGLSFSFFMYLLVYTFVHFNTNPRKDSRMSPDVRFLKRNSLSNMMRLGKRGSDTKRRELCEDCTLGNLMRLGRR